MHQQNLPEIRIAGTRETASGGLVVSCDVSDEFKDWFKKDQGLKRWSQKRFEKFFNKALMDYLKENEQRFASSSILVDGKPGEVNEKVEARESVRSAG